MNFRRVVAAASVLPLVLAWAGCGETFRPVAVPLIPPPVSPGASHFVVALSDNGVCTPTMACNSGASTRIDVSGDTNVGVAPLGLRPVHAALLPNSSRIYVANSLEDTVSSFAPTSISPITTTSLPTGAKPVFVHTTENGAVYVAGLGTAASPPPAVYAISTTNNVVIDPPIPVGVNPVALAETPDARKLYAMNEGDLTVAGSVTSIDTATRTVTKTITDPNNIVTPVWAVARPDSARVYVLNSGSGMVSDINSSTANVTVGLQAFPPDSVIGNTPVGTGANFMVYDPNRTRLYVINPTAIPPNVVVLDASTDPPTVNPPIDLTAAPPGAVSLCATQACHPVSITVLPDGSRAYVGIYAPVSDMSQNPPAPAIEFQVAVLDTQSNAVRTLVPLNPSSTLFDLPFNGSSNPTGCGSSPFGASPLPFRLSVLASADSSRVYVANCDSGNIEMISTSDDTLIPGLNGVGALSIPAPLGVLQDPKTGNFLPQNPVFMLAGP